VLLAVVLATATARAAGPTPADAARAEALFREAKRLMSEQRYAEACPKLEESQRLDPGGGTLLNLALCHRGEGKSATAWREYKEALALAQSAGRADRVEQAQKQIAALEPLLPYLTITVPTPLPGLTVQRDGAPVATFEVAEPVDPGPHTVSATAPGRVPWQTTVTLGAAERQNVTVPPLAEVVAVVSAPPPARWTARRIAPWAAGGAGVVAITLGAVYGLKARSTNADALAHCSKTDTTSCDATGVALTSDARGQALVSTIAFSVGAAAIVTGAALLYFPRERKTARLRLTPVVAATGGGLTLAGGF
jgi:hypothetical protein